MKYLKIFQLLLIFILAIGCESSSKNELSSPASNEMIEQLKVAPEQQIEVTRKLIKTGRIEFEVNDLISSKKNILETIKTYNSYISSDQEYKSIGRISNTISIRVPAKDFDNLLNDITKGVTRFDAKQINVEDVTEEFLDIDARLKTKKELETRYLEILEKANTVKEILEVERELGQLRSDIESIEGRLKYLKNQVSLATLTITIYQQISNETRFGNKFRNGFKNGMDNLIWFFVYLTNIWPFMLIIILVLIFLNFRNKKGKTK